MRGSVLVLIQFDVCEEIRLDDLRKLFGARSAEAKFKIRRPTTSVTSVTPVEESLEPLLLECGERLEGQIKYYDYGVVSLVFELPFSGDWETLVQLSSPLDLRHELRNSRLSHRQAKARTRRSRAGQTVQTPSGCRRTTSFSTSREIAGAPSANELLNAHGRSRSRRSCVARPCPLSDGERQEILQSRMSYYPTDLAVIGWNAAFIYDTPRAPRPRSSFCNTRIRSCSNSATTTN